MFKKYKKDERNENGLMRTLDLVGIHEKLPTIISHGYLDDEIKHTHRETNNLLQESIDNNSLGECIHITGEMRALTDPFHRYICEEISQKEKDVFRVVYNLPEEHMNKTTKILEWNLDCWASDGSDRKWHEELRTIYSIANRSVNLYALDTSEEIQYSVFGNKYILLQEKHRDGVRKKHTWLLESESINSMLTVKAEELIKQSKDVDEGNYRRFTQNLSSVASKRFLTILDKSSKDRLSIDELLEDEVVNDFTDSPEEIIDTLKIMNFINNKDEDSIEITKSGREFIKW